MVSRSNGCSLCVQRRVKCDERLPGCARCEVYGKPCPGYARGFKFVTGKPYRSRRHPKTTSNENSSDSQSSRSSPAGKSLEASDQIVALAKTGPQSMVPGNLNVVQCLDALTDELSRPFPSTCGYVISRWFLHLPSLYGRSRTLDSTIKSFVAHHMGNMTENRQAVRYSRFAYLEALNRLQHSLSDPNECFSTEVYCSVLLLCLYELFTNTNDNDSWLKHARGLSQLTEARGPSRYLNDFDNTLLKASRGLIVMYSMFGGQKCILASDDWHFAMKQHYNPGLSTEMDKLVEQFFAFFTHSPDLVHRLYNLKDACQSDSTTLLEISEILAQALSMQRKLDSWYDEFCRVVPMPSEVLSSTNDPLYPVVLSYSDVNSASIFCGYYSYMVLIHTIFQTCGSPGEHAALVTYFRDEICRSVEYCAQGLLGPYRMGFPLKVAYEVADPVTREWIRGCLKRISKFYAALQPQNF